MRLQVFSVYDQAVALFMPPIFLRSKGEAVRALRLSLKGEHAFAQSPDDYVLYWLGYFDESTGTFEPPDGAAAPERVCELSVLKED